MALNSPASKIPTARKTDLKTQRAGALQKLFGVGGGEVAAEGFKLAPPSQIAVGPQPRTSFPSAELDELADSIAALRAKGGGIEGTGILQPLLVRPLESGEEADDGARYRLIAGERRLRAARNLTLPHVPIIVLGAANFSDPAQVLVMQLVENLQRQGVPPLEEARGFRQLMNENSFSVREAASLVGRPKSYLSDRLSLLKMGDDVQELISQRGDTLLHARALDAIADKNLRVELIGAAREGASLREITRRIAQNQEPPSDSHGNSQLSERSDSSGGETAQNSAFNSSGGESKVSERSDSSSGNYGRQNPVPADEVPTIENLSWWALNDAANALEKFVYHAQHGGLPPERDEREKMKTAANRLGFELEKLRPLLGIQKRRSSR